MRKHRILRTIALLIAFVNIFITPKLREISAREISARVYIFKGKNRIGLFKNKLIFLSILKMIVIKFQKNTNLNKKNPPPPPEVQMT